MDFFKNPNLGIAKPAPTPAPVTPFAPPINPMPAPAPLPKPAPPAPPPPLPAPAALKPPTNVKGSLNAPIIPIILAGERATLTWNAVALQPMNTTYEIYIERDNLTRLPDFPFATEPELFRIVVHTQGKTSYSENVGTTKYNARLRIGETVRYYVVARADNGTLTPTYAPGLFGVKVSIKRTQ